MWDLIISVPDHCLYFYFFYLKRQILVFDDLVFFETIILKTSGYAYKMMQYIYTYPKKKCPG